MIVACIGHGISWGICVDVTFKPVAVFNSLEEANEDLTKKGFYEFIKGTYFRNSSYPEPHRIDLFEVNNNEF